MWTTIFEFFKLVLEILTFLHEGESMMGRDKRRARAYPDLFYADSEGLLLPTGDNF